MPPGRSGEYVKKCALDGMPVLEAGDPKMPGGRVQKTVEAGTRRCRAAAKDRSDSAPASA